MDGETVFYPGRAAPANKPAVIMATTGELVTYGAVEDRSRRLARLLQEHGLRSGDRLALLMENHLRYLEVCWAALRSGLFLTPISWHLKPDEVAYILRDCGARALVTAGTVFGLARSAAAAAPELSLRLLIGGPAEGWRDYDEALADYPPEPLYPEMEGDYLLYSSGTTGRPKGVVHPLTERPFGSRSAFDTLLSSRYELGPEAVYLSPAPLYHAAPLGWAISAQRWGATVVVMESFDPRATLAAIERYRVTHAQFVPTMFVRLLKLPDAERRTFDTSSLRTVVHGAAPCSIDVKRQMLDWWGPIIHEYYAGSEGNGYVAIGPEEWLSHPGSVGRPVGGYVHILDEEEQEAPVGQTGVIWFEGGSRFEYHKDPVKTAGAHNRHGWSTLGDIGFIDQDGYLYLTDRLAHTIVSGGVNIYPREVEDVLVAHPAVLDVAVIGVPNDEFGEEVKAVVQVDPGREASPALGAELIDFCRARLATYKCPRTVDFVEELPRLPTGKLFKRLLRGQYWAGRDSRLV